MRSFVPSGARKSPALRAAAPVRELRTRPPMERMQQIFSMIKTGRGPNRHCLAAQIEVNVKTIQRDLDFMRDRLRLPIRFDPEIGGYVFTEPVANFPMLQLTEAELFAVLVAQKALAHYRGTVFEAPLRSACAKLCSSLGNEISLSWEDLASLVSFRSFAVAREATQIYQVVAEAVRHRLELEFDYQTLQSTQFAPRRLRPFHLACIHEQWYVIGHCIKRGAIRTFLLARMRNPRQTETRFDPPADFSIGTHLKNSFGAFHAEGDYLVRLLFDPFGARLVRERIWHPSQQIQELGDGGVELQLRLSSLLEVESWILSWGEHVRVLAPAGLRKQIARRLRLAAAQTPG